MSNEHSKSEYFESLVNSWKEISEEDKKLMFQYVYTHDKKLFNELAVFFPGYRGKSISQRPSDIVKQLDKFILEHDSGKFFLNFLISSLGCFNAVTKFLNEIFELLRIDRTLPAKIITNIALEKVKKTSSDSDLQKLEIYINISHILSDYYFKDEPFPEDVTDNFIEVYEKSESEEMHGGNMLTKSFSEEHKKLIEKFNSIKSENAALKQYKKKFEKLKKIETEASKLEKEKSKLLQKNKDLTKQINIIDAKCNELESGYDEKVNNILKSGLHEWFKKAEDIYKEINSLEYNCVSDKATALIEKQKSIDKHSGNRKEINERVIKLRILKDDIESLSINSINPLEGLNETRIELENEIVQLNKLLSNDNIESDSEFVRSFKSKIGTCPTIEEIQDCKKIIRNLFELGVIFSEDIWSLYKFCDERICLLHDKESSLGIQYNLSQDSVVSFKKLLETDSETMVLADGHNILILMDKIIKIETEDVEKAESLRKLLSKLFVDITKGKQNFLVNIYFDSEKKNEYIPSNNVKVIYSGGKGENKADKSIQEYFYSSPEKSPNETVIVISNDKMVKLKSESCGAIWMDIDEFYTLIHSMGYIESGSLMIQSNPE